MGWDHRRSIWLDPTMSMDGYTIGLAMFGPLLYLLRDFLVWVYVNVRDINTYSLFLLLLFFHGKLYGKCDSFLTLIFALITDLFYELHDV